MAHTCGNPAKSQNNTVNTAPKGKWSHEADVEQPAPGKKAKAVITSSKCQHKVDDSPTVESDLEAVTTKKMKTGKDPKGPVPQASTRCSGRAHAMTPTTPAKRK